MTVIICDERNASGKNDGLATAVFMKWEASVRCSPCILDMDWGGEKTGGVFNAKILIMTTLQNNNAIINLGTRSHINLPVREMTIVR